MGRLKSKACLWLPTAGSFSSAGEQGLVVLIIGFLSASGPGALSKALAAAGRMAGGCPGVEAGRLMGGHKKQGRQGGRNQGMGRCGLCSSGQFLAPICVQLSISP